MCNFEVTFTSKQNILYSWYFLLLHTSRVKKAFPAADRRILLCQSRIWPDDSLSSKHQLMIGLIELSENLLRSTSKDEVITEEGKGEVNCVIHYT